MRYIFLNKTIKKPMYLQLKDSILDAIQHGVLNDQDQLPTEQELSDFFEISKVIIRKAYELLAYQGYVYKIQGKGTFVQTRTKFTIPFSDLYNIENTFFQDSNYEMKPLLLSSLSDPKNIHQTNVKAIAYYQNVPLYLQTIQLNNLPVSSKNQYDLDVIQLKQMLQSHVKLSKNRLSAKSTSASESRLLKIPTDSPSYLLTTYLYDDSKELKATIRSIFPGRFFRFEVVIT